MLKSVEASLLAAAGQSVLLTVSIGVARVDLHAPIKLSIARADQALYRSKARGRNCVMVDDYAPADGAVGSAVAGAETG